MVFYSFIINDFRVLSNVSGAEPEEMWYFRFDWVDMKKIHVLTLGLGSRPKALLHVLTFPKIAYTFRQFYKVRRTRLWNFLSDGLL